MGKRILIGLLAIAVIGIVAFVVSRPQKGTLEWHKREYLAASNRLAENRFFDRLRRIYYGITKSTKSRSLQGMGNFQATRTEHLTAAKLEQHRKALVELGCVSERQFALRYRPVDEIKVGLANILVSQPDVINARLWVSTEGDTILVTTRHQVIGQFSISTKRNTIILTAPRDVVAKYEKLIRKVDRGGHERGRRSVPGGGKHDKPVIVLEPRRT